jgi:hypothetical protein
MDAYTSVVSTISYAAFRKVRHSDQVLLLCNYVLQSLIVITLSLVKQIYKVRTEVGNSVTMDMAHVSGV